MILIFSWYHQICTFFFSFKYLGLKVLTSAAHNSNQHLQALLKPSEITALRSGFFTLEKTEMLWGDLPE